MVKLMELSVSLLLLTSTIIIGMEKTEEIKYTVGLKIINDTFAGQPINPVHITLTYLGAADQAKLEKAVKLLTAINGMRPIKVKIGDSDVFGTQERPVPVRKLIIDRPELEEQLIKIHQELGVCEPSQPQKLAVPNWHIAARDPKLQTELSEKAKKEILLLGGKLFIKRLGNFDPIVEFE